MERCYICQIDIEYIYNSIEVSPYAFSLIVHLEGDQNSSRLLVHFCEKKCVENIPKNVSKIYVEMSTMSYHVSTWGTSTNFFSQSARSNNHIFCNLSAETTNKIFSEFTLQM